MVRCHFETMKASWRPFLRGRRPAGQVGRRIEDMDDRRIMVPLPDAGRMAAIVDAIENRMAHLRRQSVVDGLLANAHAPYIRPGRVGTELRRRIAAEGRVA
jgi:hypothetical protein